MLRVYYGIHIIFDVVTDTVDMHAMQYMQALSLLSELLRTCRSTIYSQTRR